jgi:hypothetical protein
MNERYEVEYKRDLWAWTAYVYDRQEMRSIYMSFFPVPLAWLRKRVARAIARYERGETLIKYSS